MGVISKKELPQLKELLGEMNLNQMPLKEDNQEAITLFLSFDIVNSTRYKSLDKEVWSLTISKIVRRIISSFSNCYTTHTVHLKVSKNCKIK